eukprot:1139221-Prorocentrum_lima.AAC.1
MDFQKRKEDGLDWSEARNKLRDPVLQAIRELQNAPTIKFGSVRFSSSSSTMRDAIRPVLNSKAL